MTIKFKKIEIVRLEQNTIINNNGRFICRNAGQCICCLHSAQSDFLKTRPIWYGTVLQAKSDIDCYKVIRGLESIDRLWITPIHRIGLIQM